MSAFLRYGLATLLAVSSVAFAQAVRVDAVQAPAWLERAGRAVPLTYGTALMPQDKLLTGANARVRLMLAEGSAVRLGENAQFVIERAEERGVFRAALSVIAGAFRYTTDAASRGRSRDVAIRVKNVTIGIRGTDLWGKSSEARDLVCLLEGSITVASEGHPAVTLDRPLDYYQKPRDGAPQVASADAKQVEAWARETAIEDDGVATTGTQWRIVVAASRNRDEAMKIARALRNAGFAAEIATSEHFALVQLTRFPSEAQARAVMANLRGLPGVELPKVVPMP